MKTSKSVNFPQGLLKSKIKTDKFFLDFYSVDSSSFRIKPRMVIFPNNEDEVKKIVKFASKNKIPITTRGAGTGLVGGALGNGIIIGLQNLRKIRISDNYVDVQAGVLRGSLDKELQKHSKILGPNPSIGPYCSLGGMISTNASGSRAIKYGSVIENLLQVKFVNSDGKIITLPNNTNVGRHILDIIKNIDQKRIPKVSKNSCGYRIDAINNINETQKIMAGSEGTLGIILSARLKIFNEPKRKVLCIISYNSVFEAARNCSNIIHTGPSSLEFVDKNTIKNIKYKFPQKIKCLLFVEYDDKINYRLQILKRICSGNVIAITKNHDEIKNWWKYRDLSLSYSLKQIGKNERSPHIIEDATVPIEQLPNLLKIIYNIKKFFPCKIIIYGHAGNGNLHVRLISKIKNKIQIKKIAKYYFSEVVKLGGTISGEHGDGLARSEFIKMVYGPKNYKLFIKLKKYFDNRNILNPNKIIAKKGVFLENLILR